MMTKVDPAIGRVDRIAIRVANQGGYVIDLYRADIGYVTSYVYPDIEHVVNYLEKLDNYLKEKKNGE